MLPHSQQDTGSLNLPQFTLQWFTRRHETINTKSEHCSLRVTGSIPVRVTFLLNLFALYNSGIAARMIYFRENAIVLVLFAKTSKERLPHWFKNGGNFMKITKMKTIKRIYQNILFICTKRMLVLHLWWQIHCCLKTDEFHRTPCAISRKVDKQMDAATEWVQFEQSLINN